MAVSWLAAQVAGKKIVSQCKWFVRACIFWRASVVLFV